MRTNGDKKLCYVEKEPTLSWSRRVSAAGVSSGGGWRKEEGLGGLQQKIQWEHIVKIQEMKRWMGNQPARCRGDFRASHAQVCKGTSGLLERVRGAWEGCRGEGFGCWGGGEEDGVIPTGEGSVR